MTVASVEAPGVRWGSSRTRARSSASSTASMLAAWPRVRRGSAITACVIPSRTLPAANMTARVGRRGAGRGRFMRGGVSATHYNEDAHEIRPPGDDGLGRPRRAAARGGAEPADGGRPGRTPRPRHRRAGRGHRDAVHARAAMITLGVLARWLHLACGLGLVGLATALLLVGHTDRPTSIAWEARMLRWARGLVVLLVCSGLAVLAYQAAVVTGRPRAAAEPLEWLRLLAQSQF